MTAAGFDTGADEPAFFGDVTAKAVEAFQTARGLRADGVCGPQTWSALVEAGYHLGDRLLYHRSPMLRGDDVALLQSRLSALGFDAGRVDGIFGPRTAEALVDFQRNVAITTDGICGPATIAALSRLGGKAAEQPVASVREREELRRAPRTLDGRRAVIGAVGGLDALTAASSRVLAEGGAIVLTLADPDWSSQAQQANAFGAELYVGLQTTEAGCTTAYYEAHGFRSYGGQRLAELLEDAVAVVLGVERCRAKGMSVPILRETRMPAVLCELGPPATVVAQTGALARAIGHAVAHWVASPGDLPEDAVEGEADGSPQV